MEIKLDVSEYAPEEGIKYNWKNGFYIEVQIKGNSVIITANKEGLISLANHFLNLAQEKIPSGYHLHLDDSNSLEDGSAELIIEKENNGGNGGQANSNG